MANQKQSQAAQNVPIHVIDKLNHIAAKVSFMSVVLFDDDGALDVGRMGEEPACGLYFVLNDIEDGIREVATAVKGGEV